VTIKQLFAIIERMSSAKNIPRRTRRNKKPLSHLKTHTIQAQLKKIFSFFSPYVFISLFTLSLTTFFWSLLGAKLQGGNADQLINSYLFENLETFRASLIPNAHTFLIKWPLFIILRIFQHSDKILILLTMLVSLLTIGCFAYILYRIEKRPLRFSMLILALSSILLFIPAQPHTGALLPVNFAMLTTRNIEYIIYIVSLILIIRMPYIKIKNRALCIATSLLTLLFASDRLFLLFSAGGAISMLGIWLVFHKKEYKDLAIKWLFITAASAVIATLLLWLISITGVTHIVGQADIGPYNATFSFNHLLLGVIFAITGILTNFGANPVFDINVVKALPSALWQRLFTLPTIGFITNSGVFLSSLFSTIQLLKSKNQLDIQPKRRAAKKKPHIATAYLLSLMLITSSVVAIIFFIITNHYYAVDMRYLTITFFTLFITLATYQRSIQTLSVHVVRSIVIILLISNVIGCFWTLTTYQKQADAFLDITHRNQQIADVIKKQKTTILIGDYWRIIPIINSDQGKNISMIPLGSCLTPRNTLTSKQWEKDLTTHSFSYLLSLDSSLTDYPRCSIDQVIGFYGKPNASTVIKGTNDHPTELLLSYEHGISKNRYTPKRSTQYSTVLPVSLNDITNSTNCKDGISVMNIVAHQDDDLLFMNPDLIHHIDAGHCIRTIYLTAGDAGHDSNYWLGRERASRAAYNSMLAISQDTLWIQRSIQINKHEFITEIHPNHNKNISLLFLRLPDGGLQGNGFNIANYESLKKLQYGDLSTIKTVDNKSNYTSAQISDLLFNLMKTYHPSEINTQIANDIGQTFHDHSDHTASGSYATQAYELYINEGETPIIHAYIGYPVRELTENVSGEDFDRKMEAFMQYSRYDGSVCNSIDICAQTPTYWEYLHHQYTTD
jgi:GlcNAc-PI de-N-acetylase